MSDLRRSARGWLLPATLAASLVLQATPLRAEIYRFVDASGGERFTTDLQQVPPEQRAAVRAESTSRDRGTLSGFAPHSTPTAAPRRSLIKRPGMIESPSPGAARFDSASPRAGDHTEMWWRGEVQSRIERVERMEARLEACEIADERRRDTSGLTPLGACDGARAGIEQAENDLDRFEEQARRADVPPGWLR